MEENVEKLKKNSLNKTWLLVAGLVILTVVLLVVSLTSKSFSPLPKSPKAVKTDVARTSLSISEEPRASTVSGTYETDVNINSDDNKISGVQLELVFDPKILTKVDIRPGDFLKNPVIIIKKIDLANGRISYALANKPGEKGVRGMGSVAVISFSKASAQETNISFLPHTEVASPGNDQSVLRQTSSAVIGALPTHSGAIQTFLSPIPTR